MRPRDAIWSLLKKINPEILRGGVLCHKLTIYKQFSTYKFINTKVIKYLKKKREKPDFCHSWSLSRRQIPEIFDGYRMFQWNVTVKMEVIEAPKGKKRKVRFHTTEKMEKKTKLRDSLYFTQVGNF